MPKGIPSHCIQQPSQVADMVACGFAEATKCTAALSSVDADCEELSSSLQQIPQQLSQLEQQLEQEKENMLRTQHGKVFFGTNTCTHPLSCSEEPNMLDIC